MVSRKVFCGARRPFITGILTPMWDGQQLAGGHTIPEARQVASRGSQQVQEETLRVTVQCRSRGHTFTVKTATLLQAMPLPETIVQSGKTKIAHSNNAAVQVWVEIKSSNHQQLLSQKGGIKSR